MNLNEFMKKTYKARRIEGYSYSDIRPRVVCVDGTSLSVQGGNGLYSCPREPGTLFSCVEVGFPSVRPPQEWEQYFDGDGWRNLSIMGRLVYLWENRSMILYYIKGRNWNRVWRYLSKDNATDSVYGYVPIELVEEFIMEHGGIDEERTFKVEKKNADS